MTISIAETTTYLYPVGGYAGYRITLQPGEQQVDDAFGAYILENYPETIMDDTIQPEVVETAPETVETPVVEEATPAAAPSTEETTVTE